MTIVSHRHRFIFLKTRKTAGSSVELWLAPHLDPAQDLFRSGEELRAEHPEIWWRFDSPARHLSRRLGEVMRRAPRFREHMPAAEVRDYVGEDVWRSYRKITIVRDPWDRTISLWKWRERREGQTVTLEDFVAAMAAGGARAKQMGAASWDNWPIYAIGDTIIADDIIRYERLEAEIRRVFGALGISGPELPRAKSGVRPPGSTTAILTAELIATIGELHAREIEHFGYAAPQATLSAAT